MINKENKSKLLLVIIAMLVLANIALLVFLLPKKETPAQATPARQDRKAYIAAFLKNEIGFDTVQLKQFDTLSTAHREKMGSAFDKVKSSKEDQFKKLAAANFTDSAIKAIADTVAITQRSIEVMSFTHLRNIRMLCKPEQLKKFDSLFGKVLTRRGEGRRKSGSK